MMNNRNWFQGRNNKKNGDDNMTIFNRGRGMDKNDFLNEYTNKEYSENFDLLDLGFVVDRFNLISAKVINDKLYIISQRDEWFIDNEEGRLALHHKNKWNVTRRYHREERNFNNVFAVLGYIKKHDELLFNESYGNKRLDDLFDMISKSK